MGAAPSMFYSGAMEAIGGAVEESIGGFVSSITSTYEMQKNLDVTLHSLQQEVFKIQCAISAARRRRITDRYLLEWLTSLIDDIYLGNYYLRTFKRRKSRYQMIAREDASNLALFSDYQAAKRRRTVKTIIFGDDELKELYDTLKKFKCVDLKMFLLMVKDQPEWPIRTYLYMDHNRLSNRDQEREQVMNFLFGASTLGENNVDILPIVGSRGGGKTSLALHCFDDPTVQSHFSLKLYNVLTNIAYSNGDYDFRTILKDMLMGCNVTNTSNDDDNTLIAMLKQKLNSERFLLLMDGPWSIDSQVWRVFWDCLRCGKQGSKVILIFDLHIYNYYKHIVNPGEVNPVIVDGFSEDEYMSFFEEHAFGSVDSEDYPDLAKMGRVMAKELGGSIWGAKIFGELLRDNLNTKFWSYFLRDCLLSSQTCSQRKDLFAVLQVISKLLSKSLPPVKKWGLKLHDSYWGLIVPAVKRLPLEPAPELKSYRELRLLGPNHCAPAVKDGTNCLEFLLTEHVFLNK